MFLISRTTFQGFHSLSTLSLSNQQLNSADQLNSVNSVMETISVMNILGHMNSRSSAIAAQTIQRHWRTSPTFTTQLRVEARGNASQLGYQPLGRDSLMGDYDFLNQIHDFWRPTGTSAYRLHKKISFADECSVRTEVDGTSPTDFHDTPDKSSRLFANTIVALFGGDTPLYKLFGHRNAPAMEAHFKDAICKLEAGQKVSIWDGQSTKLHATDKSLAKVKECFVKYNYFMKSFGQPIQKVVIPSCQPPLPPVSWSEFLPRHDMVWSWTAEDNRTWPSSFGTAAWCGNGLHGLSPLVDHDETLEEQGPYETDGSRTSSPRKVAGVKMIDQGPSVAIATATEFNVEDLEERLRKMMNLPYSK